MDMQILQERYANLILKRGINIQKGGIVYITCEAYGRDFATLLAKKAYELGAKYVSLDLVDERVVKYRLQYSNDDGLTFVPDYLKVKLDEMVDKKISRIYIICPEDPDIIKDEDPKKINLMNYTASKVAGKRFREEGIGQNKIAWNISAIATPLWGKKVFPSLKPQEAESALWDAIFKICLIDKENYLEVWDERNKKIKQRAKKLNEMKPKEFHFVGPNTDFYVGLHERAFFSGGSEFTKDNIEFEPNIPSEEIFTTPDYRTVRGTVAATRPLLINGKLVKDLVITFKDGEVVDYDASEGKENFAEYIKSDEGSKRLGELALVDIYSPIYQSGHIFEEILFDENAACHIALGDGFQFCIKDSENMTPEELKEIGFNKSSFHKDIMISSEKVDVFATLRDGSEIQIIKKGAFCF